MRKIQRNSALIAALLTFTVTASPTSFAQTAAPAAGTAVALVPSPVIAPPSVPTFLQPYVKGETLDLGDYGWLRGDLADATPEQKAQAAEGERWAKACLDSARTATRVTLLSLGIKDAGLDQTPVAPPLCNAYAARPRAAPGLTFAQFQADLDKAQLIANSFLFAVRTGQSSNGLYNINRLTAELTARPLGEQMIRRAMSWGNGQVKDAPLLEPRVQSLVLNRLGLAMSAEDRANTAWLKEIVAKQGWPKASALNPQAANYAWLMVQHADQDPVFQLQALRLMEPLLATNDVSKSDYAYLYDRIMLKLNGKQRYGSQWDGCEKGVRPLRPLEDPAALARLRADFGMPRIEEYGAMMDRSFGACPKG